MTTIAKLNCKPNRALSVQEAAVITGINAKRINRLIDDRLLPVKAYKTEQNKRLVYAYALPMVVFGAEDGTKVTKTVRVNVMRKLAELTKKHWIAKQASNVERKSLRYSDGSLFIDLADALVGASIGLKKLVEAEKRVVEDDDIRGGMPTILGTRVGVYEAADIVSSEGLESALEIYPSLCREDLEAAVIYAKAHPLRGRPKRSTTSRRNSISKTKISLRDLK